MFPPPRRIEVASCKRVPSLAGKCGGILGFYNLLEVIRDPEHEHHEELLDWLGDGLDPETFSVDEANRRLMAGFGAGGRNRLARAMSCIFLREIGQLHSPTQARRKLTLCKVGGGRTSSLAAQGSGLPDHLEAFGKVQPRATYEERSDTGQIRDSNVLGSRNVLRAIRVVTDMRSAVGEKPFDSRSAIHVFQVGIKRTPGVRRFNFREFKRHYEVIA